MITGLNHLTFAVANLDCSCRFYGELLNLPLVVRWNEGAYFDLGPIWMALILDRAAPEATNDSSYSHAAFMVKPDDFVALKKRLLAHEVEEWQNNVSFGESFYFLDPDGHKLEIHARTLPERLAWMGANPKPGMTFLK